MPANVTNFRYSASLEEEIKTVNLKWSIKDFKRILESKDKYTFSINKDNYTTSIDDSVKLRLLLETTGRTNDQIEICYIPRIVPVCLKATLFSIGSGYHTSILATKNYQWVYSTENWLPLAYISKQSMMDLLCEDSLRLEFQFSFNYTGRFDDEDNPKVEHVSTLKQDLQILLTTSTLSDVKIKSCEGIELDTHKNILAARSAVFKAHFDHGTKECVSNIIESSFETDVLAEVIQYIYTDKLPEQEMLQKVLPAADFYQVEGLKDYCIHSLRKELSVKNVIDILKLADLHSVDILKMSCLRFIKGRLREIIETDAYKSLEMVNLIKSIHNYAITED